MPKKNTKKNTKKGGYKMSNLISHFLSRKIKSNKTKSNNILLKASKTKNIK